MTKWLAEFYDRAVLDRPVLPLLLVAVFIAFMAYHTKGFKLDASAESIVLENDESLSYYRSIRKAYGSDDFLVITYTPKGDLFSPQSLKGLKSLKGELEKVSRVDSVLTILDVPLLYSPKMKISELSGEVRTLETNGVDMELVRKEFKESPIYKNHLVSLDGKTTALLVNLKRDETYYDLLNKRNAYHDIKMTRELTSEEKAGYEKAADEFRQYHGEALDYQNREIEEIRGIMDRYRDRADMFLGGVTMITSDMISFIEKDLVVFGAGVISFLFLALAFFFRAVKWVLLPVFGCSITALSMVGYLGLTDWRVTVISSNFVSILLIITMALTIHLIVRYRDLHSENPDMDQKTLVRLTVHSMAKPCFYTALTTIVAFCSLVVSDIRPVIDFGWMMTIGIIIAFTLNFIFFPAALSFFKPGNPVSDQDPTRKFTLAIADYTQNNMRFIALISVIVTAFSVWGITKLEVENRFIDNFKDTTEIYRGMEVIDQQLGGTTPLDIIIDPDSAYYEFLEKIKKEQEEEALTGESEELDGEEDLFADFEEAGEEEEYNYWYNLDKLTKVEKIHDYLEGLPQIGKVQSIATALKVLTDLNGNEPPDDFDLAIIRKKVPPAVKENLVTPFLSEDANQVRLTMRVMETDYELRRKELLEKIGLFLEKEMGLSPEEYHFTGMVVLYNNLLQSLFRSQILTIGVVFVAILFMFTILFRKFLLSLLALIPNMLSAALILGIMGWAGIPLDIMTITIAAITIGIAVDDTIHYIHRFQVEFPVDRNYMATIRRCHGSIGKAIYYTSLTIIAGFSILALSEFTPTIYFGILTGLAMLVALLGVLTLLPVLIYTFRPLGPEGKS